MTMIGRTLPLTLFCCHALLAQGYEWLPGATYDPNIPTPQSVLGYEVGDYLTDHHQMLDYVRRLDEASERVQVVKFGRSVERRDMVLVIISSSANMARLEQIRSTIARLADPRTASREQMEAIARDTPAIGWMNYANDGGETAAFEAGIQMAYQLAAGTDGLTNKILANVVTILNMAHNPDSHQTFVTWMKANTIGHTGTADPNASEHEGQWFISSDGNHYLIDTNRDAFALSQPETRAVAEMLRHWNPQVWIDNHGEPNEYHFAPFTAPMNLNYPDSLRRWATEIGRNCARYFDQYGWTYVKDEVYDLYYPGYWDSYPAFNGAVSATYETNGGGWKGMSWEKPDGTLATLRIATHAHVIADLATLETLADKRADFLRYFYEFFASGMEEADQEQFKSYILLPGSDSGRLADLVELLMRHRIEVYRTERPIASADAQTYFDRTSRQMEIPAGSFVIPMNQPMKRLAKVLLEPDPQMEESFLREVQARRARNKKLGERSRKERLGFYDVTAWSLPLTYGISAAFTETAVDLRQGRRLDSPPDSKGGVNGGSARYAYLIQWGDDAGARLAGRLLQEDYRVAMAPEKFENDGRIFPKGSLIVRVERNPESLHQRIGELARESGATVYTADSAWNEKGLSMGSRKVVDLEKPRILVLTNEPTFAVSFGSVYSLLEQRYGLRFTAGRAESLSRFDLTRYNVIVAPHGSANGYKRLLGESGISSLKGWIENGGTFIGLKGGAEFTTLKDVELTDVRTISEVNDAEAEGSQKPVESIPGSLFRTQLNNDHYLAFGYPEEIAVQMQGSRLLSASKNGANVARFGEDSFLMGHRWEGTEKALQGSVYLADVPVGRGHVILFADDPTFRAYWRGLDRIFCSALLFSTAY